MRDRSTIENLLRKYLHNELTETERDQLRIELLDNDQESNWKSIIDQLRTEEYNAALYHPKMSDEIVDDILNNHPKETPVIPIKRNKLWLRWVTAAAILVCVATGAYLWNNTVNNDTASPAEASAKACQTDLPPGSNRAILVLGDESVINLDTASDGQLITQGAAQVIKTADGEILYSNTGGLSNGVLYQKLITPKGGQFQITLSDGTQVWLNAESSVRFPSVFTGTDRIVETTGEVYFEVSKDKAKPFIVKTPKEQITVLGTSFNTNAYLNELVSKTSLIDGAIKINGQLIKPGQAYTQGEIITTNIDQDIAWKNGVFNFADVDVPTMMRQLGRWYDIEIKYAGDIPTEKVKGKMGRNLTLQQVLRVLDNLDIKATLNNRTLTIESN